MKIRNLFLASMLVLGTVACSDEDKIDNPQEKVNTYMQLELSGVPAASTRTLPGDNNTQVGTTEESTVTNAMVLLCDKGNIVQYVKELDGGFSQKNASVTSSVFPVQAAMGTYYVYVVANYKTAADDNINVLNNQVIEDQIINKSVDKAKAFIANHIAKDNYFAMFNEANTKTVQGIEITLKSVNTADNPAKPVSVIKMDRLAVKIVASAESPKIEALDNAASTGIAIKEVKLKGYQLLNGASKENLQQHWTTDNITPVEYMIENTLITPKMEAGTWEDFKGKTAEFYNHLSDFRTIDKEAKEVTKYNRVIDNYANVKGKASDKADIYCMENNPTYDGAKIVQALKGNTTGVVFQYQATVAESDKLAGKNCFYWYNGKYYYTLAAIQKDYSNVFGGQDIAVVEQELADAHGAEDKQQAISDFRVKYNIKVYTDGIMYYTYYIKDPNYTQASADGVTSATKGNYYSVMRNSIYSLKVNNLLKIGTDVPGGWNPESNPEDPVDTKNIYMQVELSVNPWVMNKIEIDLQ